MATRQERSRWLLSDGTVSLGVVTLDDVLTAVVVPALNVPA
jgi:hypothetical protein